MPNDFLEESRQTRLAFWGLGQMMKGAAYAAIFLVGIGVFLWAIYLLGLLLPEESRQTPSPYGALEMRVVPEGHDIA
ncbi:1-deoxy-D-xylulose-5-phosphate synthase [Aliigemmobacter aestuarii]|uniref:1-deoxy-D-xylulose-5-phosphate synthase n=1 Tax=Aliigemmobacter aestuarii TaxID=1445661 RepID=A0A4S3MSL8_9RHOB|nr:RC-LH1 core complex protein PufX [Gemmobacter aestuarii]THD85570.1 1-deoxy-D-xylulose-5-phosphate synthase [Gemmobacter aestuarii]